MAKQVLIYKEIMTRIKARTLSQIREEDNEVEDLEEEEEVMFS